jgi:hypothetical protein
MRIALRNADGELIDSISTERLTRLENLGFIRRVVRRKDGKPAAAILWPRNNEQVWDRLPQRSYSYQERIDIYRVWNLVRISEQDRPIFLASVLDNLKVA